MSVPIVQVGALLVELGTEIMQGQVTDALATSRKLMNLAIDMIPVDQLKEFLTERDRIWADLRVDIAQSDKVNAAADEAQAARLACLADDEEDEPD